MNRQYIKTISIEGFRGINNKGNPLVIPFNTEGVTSIFAPNGEGKSSIFDSLSYCLNDELKCFKSLERENQDFKTVRNLFHEGDGKIIIQFEDDKFVVQTVEFKINDNGIKEIVSPNKALAESLINQLKDPHNFLDYNSFTEIINNTPENAGKTFLKLIGYEKFSIIQDKLGQLTRNLERDFNINSKKIEINDSLDRIKLSKETILERLKNIGHSNKNFKIKSIIKTCEKGINKIIPEVSCENFIEIDFDKLIDSINSKESKYNDIKEKLVKKNQENEQLLILLKKTMLFTQTKYKRASKLFTNAYKVLPDDKDKYLGELFDVAINTYKGFEEIDKNTCLLCNTTNLGNKNKSFAEIIEIRINKYKKFKEQYSDFKNFLIVLIDTCDLITTENYLFSKSKIVKKVINEFYFNSEVVNRDYFNKMNFSDLLDNYQNLLKSQIELLDSEIATLKKQIPEELLTIVTKLSNYKTIQTNLNEIVEFENIISSVKSYIYYSERWAQYIITVKENFISSNNELMKVIASEISSDTQKFFQEIMMTPEIIPRIEKKDAGQKILMLLQNFYSISEKKAASLLSESYRNALCLSIYFACALKKKSTSGFIILDDITSSFDGGHQRYLLQLIKNKISRISNKKGKQIIMFTHDGELEKSLKALKQESSVKWNHYKLFKESNIKVDIKEIDISKIGIELKRKANNGVLVGVEVRKYFESIVLEIYKQLQIPMQYDLANNRDKRMLHDLITNLRNMMKLYRQIPSMKLMRTLPTDNDFIDILIVEKDVSNKLEHFESSDSSSYTPTFIVGIINKIEDFKNKFQYNCTCPEVNAGKTYYAAVNKKQKGCKCK